MGEQLESLRTWAIIPVKPFNRAKSRLASVLTPEEREKLAVDLFTRSVKLLTSIHRFAGVLVISRNSKALAIAREHGAQTLMEGGQPALNPALRRAAEVVATKNASSLLIMPADLPFVTSEDIEHILHLGRYHQSAVLVPDGKNDGTNGMLLAPPTLIPLSYGVGSFARHKALAEAANATVVIYQSPTMALDIDTPADLEQYRQLSAAHDLPAANPHLQEI